MAYCTECGTELIMKEHPTEGIVPFCTKCEAYKWPGFNTAVSMVVLDHTREHVLLIKQYGRPFYVLVAGYVNKGEDAEDAVRQEDEPGLRMPEAAEDQDERVQHHGTGDGQHETEDIGQR